MVIKKLEYKFSESDDFTEIPITGHSCSFNEEPSETKQGILYTAEISAYTPVLSSSQSALFDTILRRRAIFRVTDNAGLAFIVGTDDIPASLFHEKTNEGTPGKKYGYKLKIKHKSSAPARSQVL